MNLSGHLVETPWMGDQPDAKPLPTQDNTTQKKRRHTSVSGACFQPAISVFERSKTVLALGHSTIGTGFFYTFQVNI